MIFLSNFPSTFMKNGRHPSALKGNRKSISKLETCVTVAMLLELFHVFRLRQVRWHPRAYFAGLVFRRKTKPFSTAAGIPRETELLLRINFEPVFEFSLGWAFPERTWKWNQPRVTIQRENAVLFLFFFWLNFLIPRFF